MNELAKMGFVYDVTHIAPNGEEVEHQRVHNIMMNRAIKQFLIGVFRPTNVEFYDYSPQTENVRSSFLYGFMESIYEPSASDTLDTGILDLYGYDKRLLLGYTRETCPFLCYRTTVLNGDGASVSIEEKTIQFDSYKTLTGVFLIHDNNERIFEVYPTEMEWWDYNSVSKRMILLSAATFNNPILVEPKGFVKVKAGFSAVSA